jgi:hypothetical protein
MPASRIFPYQAVPDVGVRSIRAGEPLPPDRFNRIRRRMILEFCKWDPQVENVSTLCPFPLLMPRSAWRALEKIAEGLTAELIAAESELARRPDLHRILGISRPIRRLLAQLHRRSPSRAAGRILRFDFHPTSEGWALSEVNSDVPGGYTEASSFTSLMAHEIGAAPAGDPAGIWADTLAAAHDGSGPAALLAAPGFMEDQQITAHLARLLARRGIVAVMADPRQVRWRDGQALLDTAYHRGPVGLVVRFFQAEWLASLPRKTGWSNFFIGSRTPLANPGLSILTESKRFPLAWDSLQSSLPTWRRFLPETRDPRQAPWRSSGRWLLKTPFCNNGDTVTLLGNLPPPKRRRTILNVWLNPCGWLAQRRFESIPIESPLGDVHVCVGVYTIDGRAAGAYARLSPKQVIDYAAADAALLLLEDDDCL